MTLYKGRVEMKSGTLNVRSAPGGAVIGSLRNGDEVDVLLDEGAWLEIRYEDGVGYAAKQYILFKEAGSEARIVIKDEAGRAFAAEGPVEISVSTGPID